MTKQEFETVKAIIYTCSSPVWSNGIRVPCADTDLVISALEKIFAEELGVRREKPLARIWKEQDDEKRKQEATEKTQFITDDSTKQSHFLLRILGIGKDRKDDQST